MDEGVTPQGNQENEVLEVPPDMTNQEIRAVFLTLDIVMMDQVCRHVGPRMNANDITMTSILRDFVRMNSYFFFALQWEIIPKSSWIKFIR